MLIGDEVARKLDCRAEYTPYPNAASVISAMESSEVDLCFTAFEPERAGQITFSQPYMQIPCSYAVLRGAPVQSNAEIDQPGHKVTVIPGSAFDLKLTSQLQAATILRPTGDYLLALFDGTEIATGGLRPVLEEIAKSDDLLRILPGAFSYVEQCLGVLGLHKDSSVWLSRLLEQLKSEGFNAEAFVKAGLDADMVIGPGPTSRP